MAYLALIYTSVLPPLVVDDGGVIPETYKASFQGPLITFIEVGGGGGVELVPTTDNTIRLRDTKTGTEWGQ
jgi:hypothetical protein